MPAPLIEVQPGMRGRCRYCGDTIAWLVSTRTGKNYPVNIDSAGFTTAIDFHQCRPKLDKRA